MPKIGSPFNGGGKWSQSLPQKNLYSANVPILQKVSAEHPSGQIICLFGYQRRKELCISLLYIISSHPDRNGKRQDRAGSETISCILDNANLISRTKSIDSIKYQYRLDWNAHWIEYRLNRLDLFTVARVIVLHWWPRQIPPEWRRPVRHYSG